MSKKANDALRLKYVDVVAKALEAAGEEVLRVATNEIAIPTVDSEHNEAYVVFTIKVPTGSRDGDFYDGYSMAQEYEMKQKEKKEKAEAARIEKEKKIARDKKMREEKAAAKAARAAKSE